MSGCCSGSGRASAGSRTSVSTSPERVAVVDVLGESVRAHRRRGRRAARGVQRVPPPRLAAVPDRAGRAGRSCAERGRSAVPTTPGPTPSTARCCALRTPRTATSSRPPSRCTPVGRRGLGRLRVRAPDPRGRGAAERQRRPCDPHAGELRPRLTRHRSDLRLRGRGQLEGRRRELQRVLPLRPGPSRAVAAGAVVRRRRPGTRLGRGHPAPRGRLDVHDVGHHHAVAAARG